MPDILRVRALEVGGAVDHVRDAAAPQQLQVPRRLPAPHIEAAPALVLVNAVQEVGAVLPPLPAPPGYVDMCVDMCVLNFTLYS